MNNLVSAFHLLDRPKIHFFIRSKNNYNFLLSSLSLHKVVPVINKRSIQFKYKLQQIRYCISHRTLLEIYILQYLYCKRNIFKNIDFHCNTLYILYT